jgi:hypothetical protein
MNGLCPCGALGQGCCGGDTCNAMLGCDHNTTTCTTCGAAGQPCCAPNDTCTTAGLTCRGGVCR